MSNKGKIAILITNLLLCVACILLTVFFMSGWSVLVNVVFYCAFGIGIAVTLISYFLKKLAIFKTAFVLILVGAFVLAVFIALSEVGHLNSYESDDEKIAMLVSMINGTGAWGMLVFFLIQVLQIVILPLPAVVCYVPGTIIYGPLVATLLASAGVIVGSVIAYFIGKIWGKKAVVWIAGKETTEKYSAYFGKKGKTVFVLMQILPFFPDDILCMIAGLTSMNFIFFLVTIVVVRPVIIAMYCYLGSGDIIPFEGWGIGVWVAIIVVCIVLAVLSFKYQDKLESWIVSKFTRKNKNAAATTKSSATETAEELPATRSPETESEEVIPEVKGDPPEKQ